MKVNKMVLLLLTGLLLASGIPAMAAVQQPTDIKNNWAAAEIKSAASEGWAYTENGKFNPDKAATREEVIWMLIGACDQVQLNGFDISKKTDLSVFKDKPSQWAKDRMAIAIGNGYIQGYPDKTIMAQASITRAEFAVMLSRLLEDDLTQDMLPFSDKIPDWSSDGIKKAYGKSIIKGYPDNTFKPDSKVTKAEALVMIKRWKDKLPKAEPICNEFKKILSSVKYSDISPDHIQLSYYGKEAKELQPGQEKYYIRYVNNEFVLVINDFSQETLESLNNSLKILAPSSAQKIQEEMKSLSGDEKKTINENGKEIILAKGSATVFITIAGSSN